uniref:Uncharacterized protein n=1 Tax=Acrobeloides nanus TaxID=290746 RepID=A0A914DSN8_9BILA
MAEKPQMYGVRKAWLTWHSQNLEEFRQVQPYVLIQDEAIRRFLRGFLPDNVVNDGEEIIIKRRGNIVIITGFLKLKGNPDKKKIYWMLGFVEEFFSILLKQPVKLEFQFVKDEHELAVRYI